MSYLIKNGKIHTITCEVNVTHHCNLSCRACAHLSPAFKKYYIDSTKVFEDLSILAKCYQAEHVRLLGGEPLLHPKLINVIKAVRSSGISDRVRIVTNGVLLWKMTDAFWEQIDEIHISVYPGKEMTAEQVELCQHKAQVHNVELEWLYFERFRESYSELGSSDNSLVRRIYNSCQIAHRWRCHTVHDGYFYKCPQSLFLPQLLDNNCLAQPAVDGLKIVNSPVFDHDLLAYLKSPEPLASCKHCLGSVGKLFSHEQAPRIGWLQPQKHSTEELIDMEFLRQLEYVDPDADNLCQRSHLLDPSNHNMIAKYSSSGLLWRDRNVQG